MDAPVERFCAQHDPIRNEWGVYDTQNQRFVNFGIRNPGGTISRWEEQENAERAASRMNNATPERRSAWVKHGLP